MSVTVSAQLRNLPPAVRPIVKAARRMVKATAPKATEIAYEGGAPRARSFMWKIVRYAIDGENVVGIGTFTKHSTLFFYRGRELDDGSGLLEGRGKSSRFIKLSTAADPERAQIKRVVKKAFQLAARK